MKKIALVLLTMAVFALTITACSGGGGGGNSTPNPTAPTVAPTNVVATAGKGQVSLAFTAVPDSGNGGSPITGYDAICTATDSSTAKATGTSSPIVVTTGVVDGKSYTCEASSVNAIGIGPASIASNEVTPSAPMQVNGVAGLTATDGTNLYAATVRNSTTYGGDIYVTKFDKASGNLLWEGLGKTDSNNCVGIVLLGNYVYLFINHTDTSTDVESVWIEKIDTATGQSKTETQISSNGAAMGIIADQTTNTLYLCYGETHGWIVHVDANINTLGYVEDYPNDPNSADPANGQFTGLMFVSSDSLWVVGAAMQNGSQNRIKVFEYTKSLPSDHLIPTNVAQYRNFSDSSYIDQPTGVALSNDEKTLYIGGSTDLMSSNPRNVLLKTDTTNLSITATDLGQASTGGLSYMAFDSSSTLHGVLNGSVVNVNVTTMVTTNLNISAVCLTLDVADSEMFVSNGSNTVFVYDPSGNPL